MVKLTLSANAGGALQLDQHRILIDALHDGKVQGFSTLDHPMRQSILCHSDFENPELVCFTHRHPDHYSETLMARALSVWTGSQLCLPENSREVTCGDLQITYIPLTHDGAEYVHTAHFGILIQWNGKTILIPGDCSVADEELLQIVKGMNIDLAILNFPWLTLKKGRDCLANILKPKHCVFWHLPFAQDDINGYRQSAEGALKQYSGRLLYDPFQSIQLDI